jgi:hypothetical protein
VLTDGCGTSIETVLDQLLSNGAEIDDDLTGLDLVYLIERRVVSLEGVHAFAGHWSLCTYRTGLDGLDGCHFHPMMKIAER